MKIDQQVKNDISFLLSFVDYLDVESVPNGLSPEFYLTLSADSDRVLVARLKQIRERYGIEI